MTTADLHRAIPDPAIPAPANPAPPNPDLPNPDAAIPELVRAALEAAQHSYAPYSGFHVGSALLLSNGYVVSGANVENVSYGLTICAERAALVRAVAKYGPEIRIAAAAIVNLNDSPSPPCGACRQVLAEFIDPDAPVSFPAERSGIVAAIVLPFHELLPYGFDLRLKPAEAIG